MGRHSKTRRPEPLRGEALTAHLRQVATRMRLVADLAGPYDGRQTPTNSALIARCRQIDFATGTILICTRDVGHHSSGWLKNPDFEQCEHLSLSFFDPPTQLARPFDRDLAAQWATAFFGDTLRLAWVESPKTPEGELVGVQHWRVFCGPGWVPLLPRGEMYSTRYTEIGW